MTEPLLVDRSNSFPFQEVLTLSGPLTASNAPAFQNAMRREESANTLILDLSEVPYVDSAGLGLLVTAHVSRPKPGRKLVLSEMNQRLGNPLHLTRVAGAF